MNNTNNYSAEKSKAKQSRLALIAGLLVTFGIILIIVLIFMQKNQIEENNVVTTMSIDKLQENVDTLEDSTADLRAQLESMLTQLDAMDSVIQTNKETVESISTTATGSGENIARVEKDALALQKTLNEYIKQFETETTNTNTEVKNSFEVVNNDIDNMLNTQNNNYENLSNQMTKTLNDLNDFLTKIEKENDTQYKDMSKQVKEFETTLNEYLENFNTELNETLENNLSDLNTHLDTVQNDIATTKSEITDLLNQINQNQTQDLQEKFDAVQKHLDTITTHFDETLANIEKLIKDLSAQNKAEYEGTIEKLTSVQTDLTTLNNDIADEMSTALSNMQQDYTQQISTLQDNVNTSFTNVNTTITSQTTTISNQITDMQNSMNSDNSEILNRLEQYQQKVDQSFTSVSNGKKELAAALLTKNQKVADDATFSQIADAIRNIEQNYNIAGSTVPFVDMEIIAHFHSTGGDALITFHSFDEYNNYLQSHKDDDQPANPGGCYNARYTHKEVVRRDCRSECVSGHFGDKEDTDGIAGNEWDYSVYHCDKYEQRCYDVWGDVLNNYYSPDCGYTQGQIVSIKLIY